MRLLVVDDHLAVAEAFAAALGQRYPILGVLNDHREVLRWLTEHDVDLVLLDSTLPGCDLFELVRRIRHVRCSPHVVIMSMFENGTDWPGIRRMGAAGVVSKSMKLTTLIRAIETIWEEPKPGADGDPAIRVPSPTSRQMDVIIEKTRGESRKEIAAALGLGQARVDELVAQLKQLTGAHDWADLMLHAINLGWIEPRVPHRGSQTSRDLRLLPPQASLGALRASS